MSPGGPVPSLGSLRLRSLPRSQSFSLGPHAPPKWCLQTPISQTSPCRLISSCSQSWGSPCFRMETPLHRSLELLHILSVSIPTAHSPFEAFDLSVGALTRSADPASARPVPRINPCSSHERPRCDAAQYTRHSAPLVVVLPTLPPLPGRRSQ